jgi:hypothetical protein
MSADSGGLRHGALDSRYSGARTRLLVRRTADLLTASRPTSIYHGQAQPVKARVRRSSGAAVFEGHSPRVLSAFWQNPLSPGCRPACHLRSAGGIPAGLQPAPPSDPGFSQGGTVPALTPPQPASAGLLDQRFSPDSAPEIQPHRFGVRRTPPASHNRSRASARFSGQESIRV